VAAGGSEKNKKTALIEKTREQCRGHSAVIVTPPAPPRPACPAFFAGFFPSFPLAGLNSEASSHRDGVPEARAAALRPCLPF
jgi:hypothetical protein